MIRAYALGQGAGTQVLVLGPWMLITGESGGLTRDVLMTVAWAINVVVAEVIIRRRAKSGAHARINALPDKAASPHLRQRGRDDASPFRPDDRSRVATGS